MVYTDHMPTVAPEDRVTTVVVESLALDVPSWVTDLNSFRRWAHSPIVPEGIILWWLRGQVWADMSKEQAFTHNRVRTRISTALDELVEELDSGLFFSEGMFLVNEEADLAGIPDAMYLSHKAIEDDRAVLMAGAEEGFSEVVGVPDMVMEVVSRSSIRKDTETLFSAYWNAGIPEYWLVNARRSPIVFDIWRHTSKGYIATRKRDGWLRSNVFDRSFRLVESRNRADQPTYCLEIR